MGSDDGAAWRGFRNRLEVGQLVDGVVIEHRPLGAFVDIGNPHLLGLVEVASLDEVPGSRPGRKEAIYPAVGTRIRAVFLGFGNPTGRQPRLRLRQSAVRAAEALQQVAELPMEQRRAFLQQALDSHDPEVRMAAIWRARYVPEPERAAMLREALHHPDHAVQAAAVGRVADLPRLGARERTDRVAGGMGIDASASAPRGTSDVPAQSPRPRGPRRGLAGTL